MKKGIVTLGLILLSGSILFAQNSKKLKPQKLDASAPMKIQSAAPAAPAATAAAPAATSLKADDMAFKEASHEFGTVQEGPDATYEFTFTNTGSEPIIVQKAQPSCGCTVPSFSSQPVPPGATGTINVAYHTKGRPNAFTKTITVTSNAGTKILTIKGNVEKAPTSSVPENTSMIKTN